MTAALVLTVTIVNSILMSCGLWIDLFLQLYFSVSPNYFLFLLINERYFTQIVAQSIYNKWSPIYPKIANEILYSISWVYLVCWNKKSFMLTSVNICIICANKHKNVLKKDTFKDVLQMNFLFVFTTSLRHALNLHNYRNNHIFAMNNSVNFESFG